MRRRPRRPPVRRCVMNASRNRPTAWRSASARLTSRACTSRSSGAVSAASASRARAVRVTTILRRSLGWAARATCPLASRRSTRAVTAPVESWSRRASSLGPSPPASPRYSRASSSGTLMPTSRASAARRPDSATSSRRVDSVMCWVVLRLVHRASLYCEVTRQSRYPLHEHSYHPPALRRAPAAAGHESPPVAPFSAP